MVVIEKQLSLRKSGTMNTVMSNPTSKENNKFLSSVSYWHRVFAQLHVWPMITFLGLVFSDYGFFAARLDLSPYWRYLLLTWVIITLFSAFMTLIDFLYCVVNRHYKEVAVYMVWGVLSAILLFLLVFQ